MAVGFIGSFVLTTDNVTLQIDGVLYLRILDPFKVGPQLRAGRSFSESTPSDQKRLFHQASYGVEDPEYAVTQLAQTTMRSELGKLTLDKVFRVTAASSPAGREDRKAPDRSAFTGKRVPQFQHRPLHQPGVRRVGDPLPPVRDQGHTRPPPGQRVHADAGEPSRVQAGLTVQKKTGQSETGCAARPCRSRRNARREPRCWSLRAPGRRPSTSPRVGNRLRFWPQRGKKRSGSIKPSVGSLTGVEWRSGFELRLTWSFPQVRPRPSWPKRTPSPRPSGSCRRLCPSR